MNRQNSAALYEKACTVIPGGVHSPVRAFKSVGGTPVYFKTAQGSTVTDADNNRLVDFCQSWGPLILGHAHPNVVRTVQVAAQHGLSYGANHEGEIRLSEALVKAFPGMDMVRMVSSGTEAVMSALRLARGATGRKKIVKFEGGYHGHSDGLLVKAGSGLATFGTSSSQGVPEAYAAETLVLPFDDESLVQEIFRKEGENIAAVIVEPLPGNNGLLEQRKEWLTTLRDETRKAGSLLIFDEVISGFRFHVGGYGQLVDIQPDLVTLGKIIGGGMPVGAVLGPKALMEHFAPTGGVYQAGTLSGNPIAMAAGLATLHELKKPGVYEKLESLGQMLDGHFHDLRDEKPWFNWRRVGSLIWLHMAEGEVPRSASAISEDAIRRFNAIYHGLLSRGFYLPPSGYEMLFLCTEHTPEQLNGLAQALRDELASVE